MCIRGKKRMDRGRTGIERDRNGVTELSCAGGKEGCRKGRLLWKRRCSKERGK